MRKLLIIITALAALGVAVSSYALWQHYAPLGSAFCNLGETFSCDLVNKSAFSEVFGIPVALIGIIGYVGIGAMAIRGLMGGTRVPQLIAWLLVTAIGGLMFSLSLTYIEFFVIGAVCILCVVSQALILAITVLAAFTWKRRLVYA
ncbi:MAG: vitamin K epoxide reductase family protein [bacterium]|nr:vitamin K epoxide reductase family protein [bacterium]